MDRDLSCVEVGDELVLSRGVRYAPAVVVVTHKTDKYIKCNDNKMYRITSGMRIGNNLSQDPFYVYRTKE